MDPWSASYAYRIPKELIVLDGDFPAVRGYVHRMFRAPFQGVSSAQDAGLHPCIEKGLQASDADCFILRQHVEFCFDPIQILSIIRR